MTNHADEAAVLDLMRRLRWPAGVNCPHCGSDSITRLRSAPGAQTRPGVHKCKACRKQFTLTAGTFLNGSRLPLSFWYAAAKLFCESPRGATVRQLQSAVGVCYRTAWRISHTIHQALRTRAGHALKRGSGCDAEDVLRLLMQTPVVGADRLDELDRAALKPNPRRHSPRLPADR